MSLVLLEQLQAGLKQRLRSPLCAEGIEGRSERIIDRLMVGDFIPHIFAIECGAVQLAKLCALGVGGLGQRGAGGSAAGVTSSFLTSASALSFTAV